jgi:hypothetical protein
MALSGQKTVTPAGTAEALGSERIARPLMVDVAGGVCRQWGGAWRGWWAGWGKGDGQDAAEDGG